MGSGRDYEDEDRRGNLRLSEAELTAIAERAADIVWERIQLLVGQSTIKLALYVVGALLLAGIAFLSGKGLLKP